MIDFALPLGRDAVEPPEARGLSRDQVRLLVADERISHTTFRQLPGFLHPGDLVVVNDSATLAGAVDATRADGRSATVHFGSALPDGTWVVELRPAGAATGPVDDAAVGERVALPAGVELTLVGRYPNPRAPRFWRAHVAVEGGVRRLLEQFGRPVAYSHVSGRWPLAAYQTVFARSPGSAEMPSAGRPFTADLVTELVTAGVAVAPITLHAGLSSAEAGEPPLPEPFRVPATTARLVNLVRSHGGRVVAVGTTVVRALESVADRRGSVRAGDGWTDLVLGPERPARAVDGLVTGWHAPGASHLELLEAVSGRRRVAAAYEEAVRKGYLWHEFGDSALLFGDRRAR
jgi:S-adenosylmethionine:tRNA ribosyltransferase-isomerase